MIPSSLLFVAFVVQKILEITKQYILRFPEIGVLRKDLETVTRIYENTLNATQADDIKVHLDEKDKIHSFEFKEEVKKLITLKGNVAGRLKKAEGKKVLTFMIIGCVLGIALCLLMAKFTNIVFFPMIKAHWIADAIAAGTLAGFGTKPLNDIFGFFQKK